MKVAQVEFKLKKPNNLGQKALSLGQHGTLALRKKNEKEVHDLTLCLTTAVDMTNDDI